MQRRGDSLNGAMIMADAKSKRTGSEQECAPTAWFAVLERARHTHDFESAARAKRELERLGVKVKYGRPAPTANTAARVTA
jgi:hypothetical protein